MTSQAPAATITSVTPARSGGNPATGQGVGAAVKLRCRRRRQAEAGLDVLKLRRRPGGRQWAPGPPSLVAKPT